jgi:hypothetical protein
MNTLTLTAARDTVARALKMCPTDANGATDTRIRDYLNEAQQRLLNRPNNPVGSTQRYRFVVTDTSVVLPRQVRTVIKGAWCSAPATVRPEWYEFDHNGPGILDTDGFAGSSIIDHGTDCKFGDLTSGETDRKIWVTTDAAEAAASYLWLYGYDENGQWIRSLIDGTWHDGERFDLGTAPALTTNKYTFLTRVHKDVSNGIVRLYEWSTTTAAVVRQLAQYEPSEKDPIYRRVFLPSVTTSGSCCGAEAESDPMVTLLVKLQHIPVSADLDAFVIGNLPALKLMCMAIQAEEEQRYADSANLQLLAAGEIDGELAAYMGDGVKIGMSFDYGFGAGNIENPL